MNEINLPAHLKMKSPCCNSTCWYDDYLPEKVFRCRGCNLVVQMQALSIHSVGQDFKVKAAGE